MAGTRTGAAAGRTQSTGEQMKETAVEAAEQARASVQDVSRQVGERARETVDRRSTELGAQMTTAAQAVREASSSLREQGSSGAATVVDALADRTERLGSYMRDASPDRMLGEVESFARRRPWLVAGAAAAVGLVASRLLKASSERRQATSGNGWGPSRGVAPAARPALERGEQGATA